MTRPRRRIAVILPIGLLVVALVAAGTWWAVARYQATHGPECTVPRPAGDSSDAPLHLDAVQLQHASTINAVGLARGESERARVIALATAWQESSLRNIDRGDRDSLGLFQQRPSQGWGEAGQIMDPVYSAGQFFDHLAKVPDWQGMSLTEAAQAVQRSGHPEAYAKWERDAQTLAEQLSGALAPTLSCRARARASTAAEPTRTRVSGTEHAAPRLADLLAAANTEMTGVRVDPVPAEGREATMTVELPGIAPDAAARALGAWLVAHATSYGVTDVTADGRQWSGHAWRNRGGDLPAGSVGVSVEG